MKYRVQFIEDYTNVVEETLVDAKDATIYHVIADYCDKYNYNTTQALLIFKKYDRLEMFTAWPLSFEDKKWTALKVEKVED